MPSPSLYSLPPFCPLSLPPSLSPSLPPSLSHTHTHANKGYQRNSSRAFFRSVISQDVLWSNILRKCCSASADDRSLLTLLPDFTASLPLLTPSLPSGLFFVLTHFLLPKIQLTCQGLCLMFSAPWWRLLGSWQNPRDAWQVSQTLVERKDWVQ